MNYQQGLSVLERLRRLQASGITVTIFTDGSSFTGLITEIGDFTLTLKIDTTLVDIFYNQIRAIQHAPV